MSGIPRSTIQRRLGEKDGEIKPERSCVNRREGIKIRGCAELALQRGIDSRGAPSISLSVLAIVPETGGAARSA